MLLPNTNFARNFFGYSKDRFAIEVPRKMVIQSICSYFSYLRRLDLNYSLTVYPFDQTGRGETFKIGKIKWNKNTYALYKWGSKKYIWNNEKTYVYIGKDQVRNVD